MQELSFLVLENLQNQVIKRRKLLDNGVAFNIYNFLQLMENIWQWCGKADLISKAVSAVLSKTVTISWRGPFHYPQNYATWLKKYREMRLFDLETIVIVPAFWQISRFSIRLNRQRSSLLQQKPEGVHPDEGNHSFLLPVWCFAWRPRLSPDGLWSGNFLLKSIFISEPLLFLLLSCTKTVTDWSCIQENWARSTLSCDIVQSESLSASAKPLFFLGIAFPRVL